MGTWWIHQPLTLRLGPAQLRLLFADTDATADDDADDEADGDVEFDMSWFELWSGSCSSSM